MNKPRPPSPDDVLRRMLSTPPDPHVAKAKPKKAAKKRAK
jgi:hypothetical protein